MRLEFIFFCSPNYYTLPDIEMELLNLGRPCKAEYWEVNSQPKFCQCTFADIDGSSHNVRHLSNHYGTVVQSVGLHSQQTAVLFHLRVVLKNG